MMRKAFRYGFQVFNSPATDVLLITGFKSINKYKIFMHIVWVRSVSTSVDWKGKRQIRFTLAFQCSTTSHVMITSKRSIPADKGNCLLLFIITSSYLFVCICLSICDDRIPKSGSLMCTLNGCYFSLSRTAGIISGKAQ